MRQVSDSAGDAGPIFDPLAVEHIGVTLAVELVRQEPSPLPPEPFRGAGVYVLYYGGAHPAYRDLIELNAGRWDYPVYIGKALRSNAKQGFRARPTSNRAVHRRLGEHAASIVAGGLDLADFRCRYLVLNDAFIGLAESVLITAFRPAWNGMGFGSKVVGKNRVDGRVSLWDSLHAGRGGRPSGDFRADDASRNISNCLTELSVEAADPVTRDMIARIKRFL